MTDGKAKTWGDLEDLLFPGGKCSPRFMARLMAISGYESKEDVYLWVVQEKILRPITRELGIRGDELKRSTVLPEGDYNVGTLGHRFFQGSIDRWRMGERQPESGGELLTDDGKEVHQVSKPAPLLPSDDDDGGFDFDRRLEERVRAVAAGDVPCCPLMESGVCDKVALHYRAVRVARQHSRLSSSFSIQDVLREAGEHLGDTVLADRSSATGRKRVERSRPCVEALLKEFLDVP